VSVLACGAPPAPVPRVPDHDLDEPMAMPVHRDAAVEPRAIDAMPGSSAGSASTSPAVAEADARLAAIAADVRAAIAAAKIDPQGSDWQPRCRELDGKLDALRSRVTAARAAAELVRQDLGRAQQLAHDMPARAVADALEACRVRYQMELPGMEGLIDDLEALAPAP
jgi:hypothetical protein